MGHQTRVTDALGQETEMTYDSRGRLISTLNAKGETTTDGYDNKVKDAQNKSTYTVYDKVGNVLSVTDALNRTTNYGYDDLNRQTSRTNALNQTTTTTYNKVGNVLTITDPIAGHTTSYGYDKLNRKTSTTDALNQTQTITYNILGNVSSSTDELGRTTSYEYDKVDRLTVTTDPLLHTTSTSYDTEGNVLTTTDALGQKTSYLYDKNNRRTQVTDAKAGTTKTGYDVVGNVATITDSVNNTTTYGYDAVDRLITDTNQLNKTRTRSYDNVGNLTQTTDRNGRKVAYSYDTLNRQTSERWLDSNSGTIKTFSASYDAVGHLITSTNPDSSYTYSYDAVDRISSIDNTGTVGVPAVKFNYGYDAVGNLLSVNDSINGTNAGITGYTYDLLNRVTKLTQGGTGVQTKRVNMAYNAVNQLTSLSRFSGVNGVVDTSYVYDNNQRLIQLSHKKGASTVASYDYGYDNADKLAATVSSVDGTSNYNYDATNQLTGASYTSQVNEAYSYDANGNRTSGGTVTGVNNQLLNDGTYAYQYDGEGNRTKRTEIGTGKVTEYIWDYRNRLASVLFKDAGGSVTKTIDYIYDGNNQRIGKRIDGAVVERYVIDRNQIALVFDGAGVQTHRYLYGTQVDQVLADETTTGMVWALADNQGTVKDLVDNNGVVVNHITYDSFGKVVAQSNANVEFRYGYTGREQDGKTGLDYYRARYYDASNGRFISEDPIGFNAGDGNLARYVGNSPLNGTDPMGEQSQAIFGEAYKMKKLLEAPITPLHQDIINSANRTKVAPNTEEWNDIKALQYWSKKKNSQKLADDYVNPFKNQWVCGYKDVITSAATKFNIPPRLLAAIAWREVGGGSDSLDDIGHSLRTFLGGLTSIDEFNKPANETSFGDLSIQVRRASTALGYNNLNEGQQFKLLTSLRDHRQNIFISAKYISGIKNKYLPDKSPDEISERDLQALAGAYTRGAAYEKLEDFWTYNYAQYGVSAFNGLNNCGCFKK